MKLCELPESIRTERFYLFMEIPTDTCDMVLGQVARTEEEDKEITTAVVTPCI